MATYRVQGPDGAVHRFEGPDGATPEQVTAAAAQHFSGSAAPQSNVVHGLIPGLDDMTNAAGNALSNAATFGLFGKLSNAVNGDAAQQEQQAGEHPFATFLGGLAGSVATAAPILKALQLGNIGRAGYLALKSGQPIKNILRLSAVGGIGTGALGGVEGAVRGATSSTDPMTDVENAATGAVKGAVTGGVLGAGTAGVAGAAAPAARAAYRAVTSNTEAKGLRALAQRISMKPQELADAFDEFTNSTGHPPALVDVIDARSGANLKDVSGYHNAGAILQEAEQANRAETPGWLRATINNMGQTTTPNRITSERDADWVSAYGDRKAPKATDLLKQPVTLTPADKDLLDNPLVRSVTRPKATASGPDDPTWLSSRIGEASNDLTPPPVQRQQAGFMPPPPAPGKTFTGKSDALTVDDFDQIRQALRSAQATATDPQSMDAYGKLADSIAPRVSQQHPAYQAIVDRYAAHSRLLTGYEHAATGTPMSAVTNPFQKEVLDSAEGQLGRQMGARARLEANLGTTENKAASGVADLAQEGSAELARTNENLGVKAGGQLQNLAQSTTQSLQNRAAIAPNSIAPESKDEAGITQRAVEGGAALFGHTLTGFKAHVVDRLLAGKYVLPKTASKMADMMVSSDPSVRAQVIRAMQQRGVDDATMRDLQQRLTTIAPGVGRYGAGLVTQGAQ